MQVKEQDRIVLRELAQKVAEIAQLPVQGEKKQLWRGLNGLKDERPMVCIDQVCWNEMNVDDKLTLRCEDPECQKYEGRFRRILYQWEHFPVDMVVEPFIKVQKAVTNPGFGVRRKEETLKTPGKEGVSSHKFENQFNSIEDLEKIKVPQISHDKEETARRMEKAAWLFEGIMPLREEGVDPYVGIWDTIAEWMSVEGALYGLIDEPDMMHGMAKKIVDGHLSMLDQLEEQGLLCHSQALIHCTGAFTDELPALFFNPQKPRTKDIWMFGLAQMFATVSPAMFEEYEIDYMKPIFERFGLVYYGCCDPLDGKMNEVKKIKGLRKVSMSPWAKRERGAEEIGKDYVYSCKPNPAFLASTKFDEELVRKDLTEIKELCRKNGCPLEFILKDLSTLNNEPQRLWRWAEIAMEVAKS
ncbi:MAG: hypothetical protein LBI14_09405 [Treponema sp.]|jgi:hypothetical protein|nr:hypothetical protein [Treponema sp.]